MIYEDDLAWYESEKMDDTDDAGGRMTTTAIIDGRENNIFPDISTVERVFGGVKIRKIFARLNTETTEGLYDPFFIVAERPADPYTNVLLFSTRSWTDRRPDIVNRVEQYLAKGPRYPGTLYDMQIEGARAITFFQSEESEIPSPGDVLVLVYHEGLSDEQQEYIRLESVDEQVRHFTTLEGGGEQNFTKRVVICTLSAELSQDFPGSPISKYEPVSPPSTIRYTVFADAARYYGQAALANPANTGATSITVDSIFQPLVPSAQQEVPIGNLVAGASQSQLVQAGPRIRWKDAAIGTTIYLGGPVYPGSIVVSGTLSMSDTRTGLAGSGQTAQVDYRQGIIYFPVSGTWVIDAAPAADVSGAAFTHEIPVTLANRGFVWTYTLPILPAPGTVTLDFEALGNWYRLADNGAGRLTAAVGGSGTVSYSSGLVTASLSAMPDVDTSILLAWSVPVAYRRWDHPTLPTPAWLYQLPAALTPGQVEATWKVSGVDKTLADNGAGLLTGHATGTVDYVTGKALVRFTTIPDGLVAWNFEKRTTLTGSLPILPTGNTFTFTIPGAPLEPGQVSLIVPVERYNAYASASQNIAVRDDGDGNLTDTLGWVESGTINYTNGTGSLTIKTAVS